jgi:hypothetical protein
MSEQTSAGSGGRWLPACSPSWSSFSCHSSRDRRTIMRIDNSVLVTIALLLFIVFMFALLMGWITL